MKLTVFAYICLALFCALLVVGVTVGNAWIALSCVIPLIMIVECGNAKRFHKSR